MRVQCRAEITKRANLRGNGNNGPQDNEGLRPHYLGPHGTTDTTVRKPGCQLWIGKLAITWNKGRRIRGYPHDGGCRPTDKIWDPQI